MEHISTNKLAGGLCQFLQKFNLLCANFLNVSFNHIHVCMRTNPPYFFEVIGTPRLRRGSGLDCGSEEQGSIRGIPLPRVGPLINGKVLRHFAGARVGVGSAR